jgi:hypothetical protein
MDEKIITYEDIERVNKDIKTVDIQGHQYALVSSRVQAFRRIYPQGTIIVTIEDQDPIVTLDADGKVIKRQRVVRSEAKVYADMTDLEHSLLANDYAEEIEGSSNINRSSFIENCTTSAKGRALANIGIGSESDIASAEEVINAQGYDRISKERAKDLSDMIKAKGKDEKYICKYHGVNRIEDMTVKQFAEVVKWLK